MCWSLQVCFLSLLEGKATGCLLLSSSLFPLDVFETNAAHVDCFTMNVTMTDCKIRLNTLPKKLQSLTEWRPALLESPSVSPVLFHLIFPSYVSVVRSKARDCGLSINCVL